MYLPNYMVKKIKVNRVSINAHMCVYYGQKFHLTP